MDDVLNMLTEKERAMVEDICHHAHLTAEHRQNLEVMVRRLASEAARVKRLELSLRFYARRDFYIRDNEEGVSPIEYDGGNNARTALSVAPPAASGTVPEVVNGFTCANGWPCHAWLVVGQKTYLLEPVMDWELVLNPEIKYGARPMSPAELAAAYASLIEQMPEVKVQK